MDASERLLVALEEAFGSAGRVAVDDAFIARFNESLADLLHPELETVMAGGPDGSVRATYRGPEGLREAWRDWLGAWERVELEVEGAELLPGGVVSLARQVGVTKHDSVAIEQPSAAVFVIGDDLVVRIEFHLDRAAAYRALGQSSQA